MLFKNEKPKRKPKDNRGDRNKDIRETENSDTLSYRKQ